MRTGRATWPCGMTGDQQAERYPQYSTENIPAIGNNHSTCRYVVAVIDVLFGSFMRYREGNSEVPTDRLFEECVNVRQRVAVFEGGKTVGANHRV